MGDKVFSVMTLLVVGGILTSLVLPGRQTPQVISATLNGFTGWQRASMGTAK